MADHSSGVRSVGPATDYYYILTPELAKKAKELGLIYDHIPVFISEKIPESGEC